MLADIAILRRDLDESRSAVGRVRALENEFTNLREELDQIRERLKNSERENYSLLLGLVHGLGADYSLPYGVRRRNVGVEVRVVGGMAPIGSP